MFNLDHFIGFDWNEENKQKNWEKHQVDYTECEQVFFNKPLIISEDIKHSSQEQRFYALGQSDINRTLFIVFTVPKEILPFRASNRQLEQFLSVYPNL